jgi:methionine-S-sulfoxide reductase
MSQSIILAGGCFWCIEAVFQHITGVTKVVSGYAGGEVKNPTYEQVCGGKTGHAEAVQVTFDETKITLLEILEIFWHLHDPTTLNRQGADVGTQYRSAIFYTSKEQKEVIDESLHRLMLEQSYTDPITTEISPLEIFYEAEEYHQNYFNTHPTQGYCSLVINPKISKLRKMYFEKLKEE